MMKKRCNQGFTLIEITAAMAILVVGILSLLALYPVGMVSSKRSEDVFISSKQAQLVFAELEAVKDQNPPFVDSGIFNYQKKFFSNAYFYLYRTEDISGRAIPGDTITFPNGTFYVRLAIYTVDRYGGGTTTSPGTPTGKAIQTYRTYIAKE